MTFHVLAIETSCDETSVAIVNDRFEIIAQTVTRQLDHEKYGGVIPEVAARRHYETLPYVFQQTLDSSKLTMDQINAIAVTSGPGLIGALLVGTAFAKGLAYAWQKPLLGIHHIEGHIHSVRLVQPEWPLPALVLVVSGGHTHLFYMPRWGDYALVAKTRDDAIGEAFDKVAKMLELGYPGGPIIDRLSDRGNPDAFELPIPTMSDESLDFSYSGLKTAVMNLIKKNPQAFHPDPDGEPSQTTCNLAAAFQKAAIQQIMDRLSRVIVEIPVRSLMVVGGVAANRLLRARVKQFADEHGLTLAIPPMSLCTDNAAMIGAVAISRYHTSPEIFRFDPASVTYLDAQSTWKLGIPFRV